MEIRDAFAQVLRQIRLEKGLTHEELAHRAGLHPTTISLLEHTKRQPSLTTLFMLADGLGIEPAKFIGEVSKKCVKH